MMTVATDWGEAFPQGSRRGTLPRARTGVVHRLATRLGRRLVDWGTRVRVDLDHDDHHRLYTEMRAREQRERTTELIGRLM